MPEGTLLLLAGGRAARTVATAHDSGFELRVFDSFAAAEGVWRRLEPQARCYAFQTFDWLREWQACIGEPAGVRPRLVSVESPSGQPWMLLPLGLQRQRLATALVWLGGDISDYHGPLLADACPEHWLGRGFGELWRCVTEQLLPFDYVHFERQPATIGGIANPFLQLAHTPNASRSHQATLAADWETYYRATRSSKTIGKHRRATRKLEENGTVEVRVPRTTAEATEILDTLLALKSRRYRELGVRDLFACERHRAFMHRMTHYRDLVDLSCLTVGGRIWAAHWGLAHGGRFYWLFPAYEQGELTALSPGAVLLRRVMAECCERGVSVFDFSVGDEPYKDEWCDREMPLHDCLIGQSARGRAWVSLLRAKLALKRRIKASSLWPRLVRLRSRLLGRRAAALPQPEAAE